MKLSKLKNKIKESQNNDNQELPDWLASVDVEDIQIGVDTVEKLAEDEDGEVGKWIKSYTDRKVSKGIETYKEKTLPDLVSEKVEEKYKKEHPEETEEQKRIRKLEEEQEKQRRENKRLKLKENVNGILSENDLGNMNNVAPLLVGDDEETTKAQTERFVESVKEFASNKVQKTTEKLADKFGTSVEDLQEGETDSDSSSKSPLGGFEYPSMQE